MQVRDVDITPKRLVAQLTTYYEQFVAGTARAKELAAIDTEDLITYGAKWPVGTVIEFRGDRFVVRDLPYGSLK